MQSDPTVPEESQSPNKEGHQEKPKTGRPPLFPSSPYTPTLNPEEAGEQFLRNNRLGRVVRGAPVDPNQTVY